MPNRTGLALAFATCVLCVLAAWTPSGSAAQSAPIQWIFVVPTSHWDYGFTDPPQNLASKIKPHLDDVVAKCEADARHRYTIESVWVLEEYMSVSTPLQVERLMNLIRDGRVALSASYVGPHSGIMSPEELNRWAHRAERLRRQYGIPVRASIVDDTPGYTWGLPEALSGSGVEFFVCGPNEDFSQEFSLPLAETMFRWQGPSGRRLLTWVSRDGYPEGLRYWHIDANAARLYYSSEHPEWQGWSNQQIMEQGITQEVSDLSAAGYPYDAALVLMAHDTLNYDSSGALLGDIATWNATHASPQIRLATAAEFFDHILATYGAEAIPVKTGTMTQRWERVKVYGQMAQTRFRETRDSLRSAEWLASVGLRFGATYPTATLDLAWRDLMRFDDHGAGPNVTGPFGLTLAELNQNNLYWMQTSLARRDELRSANVSGAASLAARVATGSSPEIVVFNSLSSPRTDAVNASSPAAGQPFTLVDAATGASIPFQTRADGTIDFVAENVPSLGYRRYRVLVGSASTWPVRVTAAGTVVESAHYRVTVSASTGAITSILDKTAGNRELVNTSSSLAFNRPVKADNEVDYLGGPPSTTTPGTPTISYQPGPVSGSLFIDFTSPGTTSASPISRVEIRLFDRLKRIDVVDTFDKSRLAYTVSANRHSEHFYAPMPFNLPAGSFQSRVASNATEPLRPPTETYLTGSAGPPVNNSHYPPHGVVLRDIASGYEVQVVSPQVFSYTIGTTLNSWSYAPTEATLLPECIVKCDKTYTDDPGYPAVNFVIEPLESNPSQGYTIYTLQFSITSGSARSNTDAMRFGGAVTSPLVAATAAANQSGQLTSAAERFFASSTSNVEITAVKAPEFDDANGVVVRLRETEGVPSTTYVTSAFEILEARESSLLEAVGPAIPARPVPVQLGAYETKTIRLVLGQFAPPRGATVGAHLDSNGIFYLRNTNSPGTADLQFGYGPAGLGWQPLAGDWNGDGVATIGLYEPTTGVFYLKSSNTAGPADLQFVYGPGGLGWLPLTGDWDGDGIDTVGLYDPSSGVFYLRNTNGDGQAHLQFGYGPAGLGWGPIAGDWDGDGIDTVGLYAPSTSIFYLRNAHAGGPADLQFQYGPGGSGWTPVAGDYNADGSATIGLYDPTAGVFRLRNTNTPGVADVTFAYGPPGCRPIFGDWNGQ